MTISFLRRNNLNSIPFLVMEDSIIADEKNKADATGQIFRVVSSTDNYSNAFLRRKRYFEANTFTILAAMNGPMPKMHKNFTLDELERTIRKKKNMSPGHDRVSHATCKYLGD